MITPDKLNDIAAATEEKVSAVTAYMLKKIAKHILNAFTNDEGDIFLPSTINMMRQLMDAGKVYEDVYQDTLKALKPIKKVVQEAFREHAREITRDMTQDAKEYAIEIDAPVNIPDEDTTADMERRKALEERYEKAGISKDAIDTNMTPTEIRKLESAYKRTNGTIKNLTRTTAMSVQQDFINACDTAYMKASHGTPVGQAITEAIDELAKKGVTVVNYGSWRKDTIEVAVARAVRTGINQANAQIILTRCAEMGVGYVKTSAHLGARVTKKDDWTNHSWWQGKVFKLDFSKPQLSEFAKDIDAEGFEWLSDLRKETAKQPEYDYPDFVDTCGYGKIDGIIGINCRHTFSPFYPGINTDRDDGFDTEENKKRYEAEQKAREMERRIRRTQREINALEGVAIPEAVEKRRDLDELQKKQFDEYIKHCKENRIPMQNDRIKVAKGNENLKIPRDYKTINPISNINDNLFVRDEIKRMPSNVQKALNKTKIVFNAQGYDSYLPSADTIYLQKNVNKTKLSHEIGHVIEMKMCDNEKLRIFKKSLVKGLGKKDIKVKTMYVDNSEPINVYYLHSENFIEPYQSRIYAESIEECLDENGEINVDKMYEVVSVAFQRYYMFPNATKKYYPAFYNYIDGVIKNE